MFIYCNRNNGIKLGLTGAIPHGYPDQLIIAGGLHSYDDTVCGLYGQQIRELVQAGVLVIQSDDPPPAPPVKPIPHFVETIAVFKPPAKQGWFRRIFP
jgi:hypothetical protein